MKVEDDVNDKTMQRSEIAQLSTVLYSIKFKESYCIFIDCVGLLITLKLSFPSSKYVALFHSE